jgi:TP901 family phage tail tape measure protein
VKDAEEKAKSGGEAGGKQFGEGFKQGVTQEIGLGALSSFIGNALANALSGATQAVRQFVEESKREFQGYQIALNTLATSGVEDLGAVKQQIAALSAEGKVFSENQVAQALAEMIKAGLQTADAMELVRRSMNVARAEIDPATGQLGDLRTIALQLSDVMAGFGISTQDTARAIDVLAKGALASKLSISELSAAIGPIGNVAKTAGLSLEETVAALAKIRDTGLSASESATQLRTVLQAAITPAAQYREQMQQLGLTVVKADGQIRPFPELLANIERVAQQGGKGLEFLSTVFGSYGINAALNLAKSRAALDEQAQALKNAEGAGKQFGDQMLEGMEQTKALEAQLQNAKRALGEQLQPVMVGWYRDVLPPVVAGIGALVQQLGFFLQKAREISDWYNSNKSIVERQADEATGGKYTDPLQAMGIEARIRDRERQLDETRKRIEELSKKSLLTTFEATELMMARRRLQQLAVELRTDRDILNSLLKPNFNKEVGQRSAPPPSRTPPPSPTSNAPIPTISSPEKKTDPVIDAIRNQTEALRDAQNRLKLAGGLEAALGSPQLLQRYKNELNQIEASLEKLRSQATTAERKRALNAALVDVREAEEEITREQKRAADKRKQDAEKAAKERLETAKRQAQLISEQLESEDRAAAAIEEEKRRRDREALEEEERERQEQIRRNDQQAAALRENQRRQADQENREREERLRQARLNQAALEQYEENARQAAIRAQQILAEGLPDPVDLTDGIAGIVEQFDQLRVLLESGAIDAEAFESEVSSLLPVLREFARFAGQQGDVKLFDAAIAAAGRLESALDKLYRRIGEPVAGPDAGPLGKFADDLKPTSDFVGELTVKINALQVALANLPEDPLGLADFLAEADDILFALLDDLDERIANLPPADPELEQLRKLRDLLQEIITLRADLQPITIIAPEANQEYQEFRRGEREAGLEQPKPAEPPAPFDYTTVEKELSGVLMNSARGFIQELTDGTPDIGAALQRALKGPADFFINKLIDGIIGPVAEQLGQTLARTVFSPGAGGLAALGPVGLAIGGIALISSLLGGLFGGSSAAPASQQVQRESFGPSSVQTRIETAISVYLEGNLENPRTRADIESLAEGVTLRVLRRLRMVD